MNDEYIKQVIDIEREARKIHENAVHESEQILLLAEQEVESILENAKTDAQREARLLVTGAQAEEERAKILAEAANNSEQATKVAAGNFDRAVRFLLDRTTGTE